MKKSDPPKPVHLSGTSKGEEMVKEQGREPGRSRTGPPFRTARDATSINPDDRDPILPEMPHIPPA